MPSIKFGEFLAHIEHYKKILSENEPIVLPRREAARRAANKEKRTRLIRELDVAETYAEFNGEFNRYIEHSGGNPQIAYQIMLRCLKQLSNELIVKLAADEQIETGSLSDA